MTTARSASLRASSAAQADAPAAANALLSIQALRFIAALAVVVYHAGIAGRHYGFLDATYDDVLTYSVIGKAGVHIFFVISGFLMVYSTRCAAPGGASVTTFLRHRLERIYPIYWLYAVIYLAFHFTVFGTAVPDTGDLSLALSLVPGYSATIIGPGWTLGYEILFYVAFGLSMFLPVRVSLLALTGLFAALIAVGVVLEPSHPFLSVATNALMLEFLAGAWAAKLHLSGKAPTWTGLASTLLAVICFGAGLLLLESRIPKVVLWGIPSTLLVVGLAQLEAKGRLPGIFCRLSALGNSSYSLYLTHLLVTDVVLLIFGSLAGTSFGGFVVLASIGVSCLIGHVAFSLLERPLYNALRGFRPQQRVSTQSR